MEDRASQDPSAQRAATSSVRIRRALDTLPAYRPGRAASKPTSVGQTYKISANENPYPPLSGVVEAALDAARSMNRYPDMFATGLVAALANRFAVPEEHIVTGTGSVGVLQQIIQATAGDGDEVIYAWRSFEAYPIVVGISGSASVQVPLTSHGRHDLDRMADAISDRTRLVIVCSPNNPTGPAVVQDEMAAFLRRVPDDILVVLDEAYQEFVRDPRAVNGVDLYTDYPNVCVLRTFSKAYGLAGLRVGFAIAPEPVAVALRKTAIPFGVSAVAQTAAVESLAHEKELGERVEHLVTERRRVRHALLAQGWAIPQTEANFVWLELGSDTSNFARYCEDAGLAVRPFDAEGCRVTIAEAEANDRFIQLAHDWRTR
jgi:histidinol-phosphate aminotransferase